MSVGRAGKNASKLYSEHPIELDPQIGLVPIGMNPRTGLWEFYQLRSAGDPSMIPEYDKEARIAVAEQTGIVFVLIPGGTFVMGAQKDDEADANYYELAQDDEKPHEVSLEPYFLARHQMTQAQWKRLSGGEEPSFYREGQDIRGDPRPIDLTRPVEQVSWTMWPTASRAPWSGATDRGAVGIWLPGRDRNAVVDRPEGEDPHWFREHRGQDRKGRAGVLGL